MRTRITFTLLLAFLSSWLSSPSAAQDITPTELQESRRVLETLTPGVAITAGDQTSKLHEMAWSRRVASTLVVSGRVNTATCEHRLWDGARVDILLPEAAVEVEWSHKWAESFGQSAYYADMSERKPLVVLLVEDTVDDARYVYRATIVARRLGVTLWLVDVKRNVLIDANGPLLLIVGE